MAKQGKTPAGLTGLRESIGRSKKADWGKANPEQLQSAIAATAKVGGALRLGYSRDGGAYAVGVYGDGDPYTLYIAPDEDIDAKLAQIENAFSNIS